MRSSAKLGLLVGVLVLAIGSTAWARKWTDAKGNVIANDAQFVRVFKEKEVKDNNRNPNPGGMPGGKGDVRVYLNFKGRGVTPAFLELSAEDQQYIREELEHKKKKEELALLPAPGTAGNMGGYATAPGTTMPAPGGAAPGMPPPGTSSMPPGMAAPDFREWHLNGMTPVRAKFVRKEGSGDNASVVLASEQGKEKPFSYGLLGPEDKAYVDSLAPAGGGAPPGPASIPGPGGGGYSGAMPPPVATGGSPTPVPGGTPPSSAGYSGAMPAPVSTSGAPGSSSAGSAPPSSAGYSGGMPTPVSTSGTPGSSSAGSAPPSSAGYSGGMPTPVPTSGAPGSSAGSAPPSSAGYSGGMPTPVSTSGTPGSSAPPSSAGYSGSGSMPPPGGTPGPTPGGYSGGMPSPTGSTPGSGPPSSGSSTPSSSSGSMPPPGSPPGMSSPPMASSPPPAAAEGWGTLMLVIVGVAGIGLGGLIGWVARDRMTPAQPKRR